MLCAVPPRVAEGTLRSGTARATAPRQARYRGGSIGDAAQRPSQLSHVCATRLGHRAMYGPVDRFNAQLVSRWNNPACHPQNAVHIRGKGIHTIPHHFAARSCDALMPDLAWRRLHSYFVSPVNPRS